jgi:hypothetical protein
MEESEVAEGYLAHFVTTALIDLVRCLRKQGALGEWQYEDALRARLDKEGAPRGRLDYVFLAELVYGLEKEHPRICSFSQRTQVEKKD